MLEEKRDTRRSDVGNGDGRCDDVGARDMTKPSMKTLRRELRGLTARGLAPGRDELHERLSRTPGEVATPEWYESMAWRWKICCNCEEICGRP